VNLSDYIVFARKGGQLYLLEKLSASEAQRAVVRLRASGWDVRVSR
jgi:hypothetical protein